MVVTLPPEPPQVVVRPEGLLTPVQPGRSWSLLAWAPIPLLLLTIVVLWAANLNRSYESPGLVILLNFFFSVLVSLFIAYLIGRSFLVTGIPGLLLLGCGVVIWGLAGFVGTIAGLAGAPPVAIHNTCVWLSAGCHLAGVVISLGSTRKVHAVRLWLAAGYAAALAAVGLVTLEALEGWLPTFFVQGQGGTTVRQVVLGSAIAMFIFTGILLRTGSQGSAFTQWYARALALIAIGLFGVLVQSSRGTLVGWTGRAAQLLSGPYMLVAAFAAFREPGGPRINLGHAITEARHRYEVAIALAIAAGVARLAFLPALGTQAPFLTFYPVVMLAALYGGVRAGLTAGAVSAILANCLLMEPVGRFSIRYPADWLALGTFLLSCTMISFITEAMHRAQARASEAQTRAEVAAARQRDLEALREAHAKILQLNESLEQKVQQRTADLALTVQTLEAEVHQRQNAEEALHEANVQLTRRAAELRALAGELTLTEQRERRRMAKVLHDQLQQLLVGAKFRIAIVGRMGDDLLKEAVQEVEQLLDECIVVSRSLTAELSPPILHHGGLIPGLEWLARWMLDKHGLSIDLTTQPDGSPAAEDVRVLLFESVRELLFNAAKHSGAKSAVVTLRRLDGDLVQIVVSDTGRGFHPKELKPGGTSGGFGLFSIRERLDLVGGRMEIESAPGNGSRFTITAPLGKPSPPSVPA